MLWYREWEGRRMDNSMLREGMQILSKLTQDQVNTVIDGLREQKKGRMLIELTSDLMYMLLQVNHAQVPRAHPSARSFTDISCSLTGVWIMFIHRCQVLTHSCKAMLNHSSKELQYIALPAANSDVQSTSAGRPCSQPPSLQCP
eukprot:1160741-Pelagomonas_calceolata.AAC.10